MKTPIPNKCPKCGSKITKEYSPPYQEYPGASIQGGYYYCSCKKCDWDDCINGDISGYNIKENTRGW